MADFDPPNFDPLVKTEFLRRTSARALTPRAQQRVKALQQLEPILIRAEAGYQIGVQGYLLASITKRYPISARAMTLELRGSGPQRLVEVAEQIELRITIKTPKRGQKP